MSKAEMKKLEADLGVYRNAAAAISDPLAKEVLTALVDGLMRLQELAFELEALGAQADAKLKQKPKPTAELAKLKSTVENAVVEIAELERLRIPQLLQKLHDLAQDPALKKKLMDLTNTKPSGAMAIDNAEPKGEDEDEGMSLWGDD